MSERYAVRLMHPVESPARADLAKRAAPRFGIDAGKLEKLLSRGPGLITKATTEREAQRVADIFRAVGVIVEVVHLDADSQVGFSPPPTASDAPPAAEAPGEAAAPPGVTPVPLRHDPVVPDPEAGVKPVDRERIVSWGPPPVEAPTDEAGRMLVDEDERPTSGRSAADAASRPPTDLRARSTRVRRFSLRWKLVLAALLPLLLFAAATLYVAYETVRAVTAEMLIGAGDSIALTLAVDLSAYITENGLQFEDAQDLEVIATYFNGRVRTITAALPDVVGIHVTDPEGGHIAGFWEVGRQPATDPTDLEAPFAEAARAALQSAEFGQPAEQFRASLPVRTTPFASFYLIGTPLINDIGAVQVVLAGADVRRAALAVMQPVFVVAAIALLIALFLIALLTSALTANMRYLAVAAERISLGELEAPVEVRGNDETRDVAAALESMRMSLKAAIDRLRRRGKER